MMGQAVQVGISAPILNKQTEVKGEFRNMCLGHLMNLLIDGETQSPGVLRLLHVMVQGILATPRKGITSLPPVPDVLRKW